jgi:hypothetical protein
VGPPAISGEFVGGTTALSASNAILHEPGRGPGRSLSNVRPASRLARGAVTPGIDRTIAVLLIGLSCLPLALLASGATTLALLLGLAVAGVPLIVNNAVARLLVVIGGAFVVFEVGSSGSKGAYFAVAVLCATLSWLNLRRAAERNPVINEFRPMLTAGAVFLAYILISLLISRSEDISAVDWLSSASPYMMLVLLPVIGLDAAADIAPGRICAWVGIIGTICMIGYAIDWVNRRHATDGVSRFMLSTYIPALFAFGLALIRSADGRRARWWRLVAVTIPVCMFLSGLRAGVIALLTVLLAVLGSRSRARVTLPRMGALLIGVGAAGTWVTVTISRQFLAPGYLQDRLDLGLKAFSGGYSSDRSYQARQVLSDMVLDRWKNHLWLGGGPGYKYTAMGYWTDTPWEVLGVFGIIGCALMAIFAIFAVRSVCRARLRPHPVYTAGRGFLAAVVVLVPFGASLSERGLSLAVGLIVCAAASVGMAQRRELEGGRS